MTPERLKELQVECENERLSTLEIIEIEEAFNEIPDEFLSDLRENAVASDMLHEIERWMNRGTTEHQ